MERTLFSYQQRHRALNWLRDQRDRWLHGLCCAVPDAIPGSDDGAYYFWRCGRERGHKGPHRTVNYLWGHEGGGFSPLMPAPRDLRRDTVLTGAQKRNRDRWHAARDLERRVGLR